MTWIEFKQIIDRQIIEKGIPNDADIKYIDITDPSDYHEMFTPYVYFDGDTVAIH